MDVVFVGLTIVFLALSWGFVEACEKLMEEKSWMCFIWSLVWWLSFCLFIWYWLYSNRSGSD